MAKELIIFISVLLVSVSHGKTLLEEIHDTASLSKAAAIIERSPVIKALLTGSATLFLPNNDALDRYDGPQDEDFLKYHLVNVPYEVQNLPDDIPTQLSGNPRIYVTKFPTGNPSITGSEDLDYFINNAKVIGRNVKSDSLKQVLHILDEALTPTRKTDGTVGYAYPKANDLLNDAYNYGLTDKFSLQKFTKRVSELDSIDLFSLPGKNTFFIPVDNAMSPGKIENQDLIDKQVIHGHIVPGKAIFTRTFRSPDEKYESYAFTDNLKVFISMETVSNSLNYVKSHIVAGDKSHQKGTVLARIVQGNIPVTNGVVHLIDRPLMVVASSIISYLQEKDGQLSKFHSLMKERQSDLSNLLVVKKDLTLFAPSNYAFEMVDKDRLREIESNTAKLGDLLRLHIVRRRVTTDEIINRSLHEEETINQRRKLYFAVSNIDGQMKRVTLEGGGVNATITTPNIAAKNGVIHIIDRILGIPSETVYEKLQSDPMLSMTYEFSKQKKWSQKFNNRDDKFTMFVPSNDAWDKIMREAPSTFKKIKMGEYANHVIAILERHTIAHRELKLSQLLALTTNGTTVDRIQQKDLLMTRGKVYFQAQLRDNFGEYYLEWNGERARVVRPDVECVNGVVHVIDNVLMKKRDITVNAAPLEHVPYTGGLILTSILTLLMTRALH